jgi:pimeloyl-ACP methyl ester carboxylesterase
VKRALPWVQVQITERATEFFKRKGAEAQRKVARASRAMLTAHQRIPGAIQGFLQTQNSCEENVQLSGFDFLDRARVYFHQFRQFFLRDVARHALAAHVCAERGKLRKFGTAFGHAPLGRGFFLRNTAQWGVFFARVSHRKFMKWKFFQILALLGLCVTVQAGLNDGLVAYYPLNGSANDATGNGNNGIVYGGAFVTNRFGITNSAFLASLATDKIATPLYQTNVAKHSVSGWFQTTLGGVIIGNNGTGQHFVLNVHTTVSGGAGQGQIVWAVQADGVSIGLRTTAKFADNKWHQVVGVFDGAAGFASSSQFSIYVDGVKQNNAIPEYAGSVSVPINSDTIRIGQDQKWVVGGAASSSVITLDDICIYSRALSASEVQQLYSLPQSPNLTVVQTNRQPATNAIGQPTIPNDPNHFKVFTNGTFQSGIALNPNKTTVVLTHGWNGSPSDWAQYTAQIIQQRIGANTVNIVAWDWHTEASVPLPVATQFTLGEGYKLGTDLSVALGTGYTQRIHFIGHSLGTLVNAAAANYLHGHGFSPTNTQLTICDEAEIAWGTTSQEEALATLFTLLDNSSTSQPFWGNPLPRQFNWADNYISACGMLHPEAANVILTWEFPTSFPNFDTLKTEFFNFHDYAHYFYEDTIEPSIFNTGGQTNATYAGFICSFEGGGAANRPGTNTYFYQDPNGFELTLAQTNNNFATNFLNQRLWSYIGTIKSSGITWAINSAGNVLLQASGLVQGAIDYTGNLIINLFTSIGSGSLILNSPHPLEGPTPNGGSGGANNSPAYAWIPLFIPSNTISMTFDFMLQGDGASDSFQAALNGTNILSLEIILIQTNVTLNSGMICVSAYAGKTNEFFVGIVGGTSTNTQMTVQNLVFYNAPAPSLQAQASGNNPVLTWPISAIGFNLQCTTNLADPNSWTTLTNVPAIVNSQNTVTNSNCGGTQFYRLKR